MRKTILLIACIAIAVAGMAQGTSVDDKNAETRNVSGFHAIVVSDGIDLHLTQGTTEAVAISAANIKFRSNIKTEVVDGVLKIFYYDGDTHVHFSVTRRKLLAYVTVKNVNSIEIHGGSGLFVNGLLEVSKLNVQASGSSEVEGQFKAADLGITLNGGSEANVSGSAASLSVTATGGSGYNGYQLITDNCRADASGGSGIYVTANKEINGKASGGSDIYYKGAALLNGSETSGGSGIRKKG